MLLFARLVRLVGAAGLVLPAIAFAIPAGAEGVTVTIRERHLDCVLANAEVYRAGDRDPMIIVLPACGTTGNADRPLAAGESNSLPTLRMGGDVSDFLPVTKADIDCLVEARDGVVRRVAGAGGEPLVEIEFARCQGPR